MKFKIIAVLTALILSIQCVAFADYQAGTTENELTVSGTASPYESVSFIILDADALGTSTADATVSAYHEKLDNGTVLTNSEIFNIQTVEADKDGVWSYTMPMTGIETKNLTIIPSVGQPEFIQYSSIEFRESIVPVIKNAAIDDGNPDDDTDDYDSLSDKITYYIGFVTDKAPLYNEISNKKDVAVYTKEIIKGIDETSDLAFQLIADCIDDAVHVCCVTAGKITDFDECMSIVDYDKSRRDNISEDGKSKVVELLGKGNYKNVEDFSNVAKFQYELQLFNYNVNQTGSNLLSVLKDSNDIFGLDFTELEKLSESNQEYAAKQLAAKKSVDIASMQSDLDEIAKDIYDQNDSGSGGGGGAGIGSATTVPENKPLGTSASVSISDQYIYEQTYVYTDIDEVEWAFDAILELSKKGIVNGYNDKTFRPSNPITRAEFTKLVVETLFKDKEFDFADNFKDVPQNEWYAKYINIAYNLGVVSGDDRGYFNPDATITRQDMAVIICNAGEQLGLFERPTAYKPFSDDNLIADYAKYPVYTLKDEGIIRGVGESLFAPGENADRAAAAQIIYSLISKKNIK